MWVCSEVSQVSGLTLRESGREMGEKARERERRRVRVRERA